MADLQEQILYKLGEMDAKLDAVRDSIESHEPRIQQLEQKLAAHTARTATTAGIFGVLAGLFGNLFVKIWPNFH